MSLTSLIEILKTRFSAGEGQTLLKSLRQDPLVWQFVLNNENSPHYFESAPSEIGSFAPGRIAQWLIEQTSDLPIENPESLESQLPESWSQRSKVAFETLKNTSLPPSDLETAGLLGLFLREKRIKNGSWEGIAEEILVSNDQKSNTKAIQRWQTAFACLRAYCPDFQDLINVTLLSNSPQVVKASLPIFIHSYLSNPQDAVNILDLTYSMTKHLPLERQLEGLKYLAGIHQAFLCEDLAKNLIQTKDNIRKFACIFSEIEDVENANSASDPLEKEIRFTLPEDISKVAALNYFAGNLDEANEYYQKAQEVLDFLGAQTMFQSLAVLPDLAMPTRWLNLVQTLPNSKQARYFYVNSLLENQQFDEAARIIEELPNSTEKQYLLDFLNSALGKPKQPDADPALVKSLPKINRFPKAASIYAVEPGAILHQTFLHRLMRGESSSLSQNQVEILLSEKYHDLQTVVFARDYFANHQRIDQAIELTAYLETLEPNEIEHKRSLVDLLIKSERWQDAFTASQEIIKIQANPSQVDLEQFSLSALKIDRLDMSISISQNILEQDPKNARALILLGEAFMLKGDAVKAIQHMEQVVEMIPEEPDTWLSLAQLWKNYGQTDRALEILNQGILAVPNDPPLLREIGKAHIQQNAPADAMPFLRKAHEIEPQNYEGKLNLARVYYQLGQYEDAYQLLKAYEYNYQDDPVVAKLLGLVLVALGEEWKAKKYLLNAAAQSPSDVEAVQAAADLVIRKADASRENLDKQSLQKIREILTETTSLGIDNFQLKIAMADIDRLQGDYKNAMAAYSKLTETAPHDEIFSNWRLPFGLGQAALAAGNHDIGLAALQDAISKKPGNLTILYALAEGYQKAELPNKADRLAKSALNSAPQNVENILWYAEFKLHNNDPEEAVRALQDALVLEPGSGQLKLALAKAQITMGVNEDALDVLSELIEAPNTNPEELHQSAYTLMHLNELKLAVKALEKSKGKSAQPDPTTLMDLSIIYSLLSDPQQALSNLDVPDEFIHQFPQIALLKSDILSSESRYQAALEVLQSFQKTFETVLDSQGSGVIPVSNSPLLYRFDFSFTGYLHRVAQLKCIIGDIQSAKELSFDVLKRQPDNARYCTTAAQISLLAMDYKSVYDVTERTNALNKDDPSWLNLLCSQAESLLLQGQIKEAAALISESPPATRRHPRFSAIQSMIASNLDDTNLARENLDDALILSSENSKKSIFFLLDHKFDTALTNNIIAQASLTLGNYRAALEHFESAWKILRNQPLINWQYAQGLIKSAEFQRIAEEVSVTNHAPGKNILEEEVLQKIKALLSGLKDSMRHEELMCLNARAIAAFTGQWPLNTNAETCADNPESAAAIIMSSKDAELVKKIFKSYPYSPEILRAYGIYALKHHDVSGRAAVQSALSKDISDPINHALLAMLNIDEPERAVKSLEAALGFWPDEPDWHAISADLYAAIGDVVAAESHINQAIKFHPDNADYWQRNADIQLQQNDLQEAKTALEKSASYQSQNPRIWVKLADLNRRMGNIADAFKNMETASKLSLDDLEIAEQEARFLLEQHRFLEAEKKAAALLSENPGDAAVLIILADALAKQGKFDEALDKLKQGKSRISQDKLVGIDLEYLEIKKDKEGYEAVLPELISFANDHPDQPRILINLTNWLIHTNRLVKAEETAQTVSKIFPEEAEIHLMLGRLKRKKGQLDQAISHLSDAVAYDPSLVDAYIELGKTYQDRRNIEEAIRVFQKGVEANASDPRLYYHTGMALKACKDYANAEKMLREAKKYSPDDTNIIRQLGVITALNLINNLREVR